MCVCVCHVQGLILNIINNMYHFIIMYYIVVVYRVFARTRGTRGGEGSRPNHETREIFSHQHGNTPESLVHTTPFINRGPQPTTHGV